MCLVFKSFKLFLECGDLESQKLLDYFYSNLKDDVIKNKENELLASGTRGAKVEPSLRSKGGALKAN